MSMTIALPTHEPCGAQGCGQLDDQNVATCVAVRTWPGGVAYDERGCGSLFSLHFACGLRSVKDGEPCTACLLSPCPGGLT